MFNTVILLVLAVTPSLQIASCLLIQWSPPVIPLKNDALAKLGHLL